MKARPVLATRKFHKFFDMVRKVLNDYVTSHQYSMYSYGFSVTTHIARAPAKKNDTTVNIVCTRKKTVSWSSSWRLVGGSASTMISMFLTLLLLHSKSKVAFSSFDMITQIFFCHSYMYSASGIE